MEQKYSKHLLPLLVIVIGAVLVALGQGAGSLLQYQRDEILAGQLWRLLSAHFVHLGWGHFALNASGLTLIWALFHQYLKPWQWLLVIFMLALFVSLGLLVFSVDVQWYVGLSGVLHGLLVVGLAREWSRQQVTTYLLASVLVIKLTYEKFAGVMPGSGALSGGQVIIDAHLYGSIGGLLLAGVLTLMIKHGRTG